MTTKDWLQQELLRGVNDPGLQRRLLQEINPNLEDLINNATLWHAQQSFGAEPTEYVRQGVTEADLPPHEEEGEEFSDDYEVRWLSEYKKEGKSNWRSQQGSDRRQARQSPPTQCGGCGAQGERIHPRVQCPARGLTCFQCGKTGHYRSVCRSPQRS